MIENDKLMELVVDKVLKKHGIIDQKPELDQQEKEKIAEIVGKIKNDVESFLENANKTKTEADFTENTVTSVPQIAPKNKAIVSNNDVKAAKTFIPKKKRPPN